MIQRMFVFFLLSLSGGAAWAQSRLLLDRTFTTATTVVGAVRELGSFPTSSAQYLALEARFTHSYGGTSAKVYLQTSLDDGASWIDIASLAFASATATKVSAVNASIALAAGGTPTDGTLTDNTILNGLLGDRIRVKLITTGTYATDPAVGIVTYQSGTNITDTKLILINTTTYTFVNVVAVAGDVKIGTDSDATMLNLSRCINKSGGTEGAGQDYMSAGGVAHPQVTAVQTAGSDIVTLTQIVGSSAGNSYPFTSDETTFVLTPFAGGTNDATRMRVNVVLR